MELYKQGSRGEMVKQIQKALHLLPDGIYGPMTAAAVVEFQREHNLQPDGIVGPATLALLIPARLKRSRRQINEIIIHCSATPEGKDYTVDIIRTWHKARGFSDIGYHYVIYRDGSVHQGRDVDIAGAHCEGHNSHSIGICYIGGCASDGKTAKDTRTIEQKAALKVLLQELKRLYPQARIRGHRDFAAKECPSFDATAASRSLKW